jgi:hypothetical protein
MELHEGGLAGDVGQPSGPNQQAEGFFEGVVVALGLGPVVLGAGFLGQGVEHGGERGGALGGEVPGELARAAVVQVEFDAAVGEPRVAVGVFVGRRAPGEHFLRQGGEVGEVRAAGVGGEQDFVRVLPVPFGEPVGQVEELPGMRLGDLAGG